MLSPRANWHRLSRHPQELARTQRQSLAPAGNLWLLRVNPEQVCSGTAFLAPCFPISTGPASISSRVWGSVLTCFYCLLIIVFSLKRNIFFDKLKTSLCNKNASGFLSNLCIWRISLGKMLQWNLPVICQASICPSTRSSSFYLRLKVGYKRNPWQPWENLSCSCPGFLGWQCTILGEKFQEREGSHV